MTPKDFSRIPTYHHAKSTSRQCHSRLLIKENTVTQSVTLRSFYLPTVNDMKNLLAILCYCSIAANYYLVYRKNKKLY